MILSENDSSTDCLPGILHASSHLILTTTIIAKQQRFGAQNKAEHTVRVEIEERWSI